MESSFVRSDGSGSTRTLNEAAHKTEVEKVRSAADAKIRTGKPPPRKRSLHEATHKVGSWAPPAPRAEGHESEESRRGGGGPGRAPPGVRTHAGRAVLALGALGVVYGDIGTSPLYTEQVVFGSYDATAHVTPAGVYGIVSLIFWALVVVVSTKYAGFIMRAHNRGDGGIMALTALLQRNRVAHGAALVTLGVFGAALFFGDGIITPAISVRGSLQGLKVAEPGL
jgi:hypothetical protein